MKLLNFFWYSILVLIIGLMGMIITLFSEGKLSRGEVYIISGIVMMVTLGFYFFKNKVSEQQDILISQSNFAHNEVFASLYERSPVGYLTIESDGSVVDSNPAAINLLSCTSDEIKAVNFYSLLISDVDTDASVIGSKAEAGVTINDKEVSINTLSGEIIWITLSVFVSGNKNQRIVSLFDVTDKKSIDTAKSEFVALATHQLRTPISAIRWNVELLERNLRETKTDDQERYLIKIERNVFRMIDLINDFLSVSKLEMGTFATNEEDIVLSEFLLKVLDEFSEKITEKQIIVNKKLTSSETVIKTDVRLLHIIISNLISNAVKYIESGGELNLSAELRSETIAISIRDNGIGIPKTEISKLFTKFYRASNAQSHQTEGTGLGLYVVKQSVELLGGAISVESGEGEGAMFVILLPISLVSKT